MVNYYDTIFKRKSVRKYNQLPVSDSILKELSEFIKELTPLYDSIEIKIDITGLNEVKTLLPYKAPRYLLYYSQNCDGYLTNAGYILAQVDLFLSSKGIGTCYYGMAQPTKENQASTELEYVVMLAFGNSAEPVHRTKISEFKRKPLSQITDSNNYKELLEAVRLAPSASNSQNWYFKEEQGTIHAYCTKCGMIKAMLYEKMNQVDMGIALFHLKAAADHFNKDITFVADNNAKENPPNGYYYVLSARL